METQSRLILIIKLSILLLGFQKLSRVYAEITKYNENDAKLIVGIEADATFYEMALDGNNINDVPDSINSNCTSIAYSAESQQFFSVCNHTLFINHRPLDNSTGLKILNDVSLTDPIVIATDTYGYKLYVADNAVGKISIFDLRRNIETFIPLYEYGGLIESISLDSLAGLLFISVMSPWSHFSQIIRMNMDGSDQVVIYEESVERHCDKISALQTDQIRKNLFFKVKKFFRMNNETEKIQTLIRSIDYNGENITNITEYLVDYAEFSKLDGSLDVFEDKIFWADKQFVNYCTLSEDFSCKNGTTKKFNVTLSGQNVSTLKIIQKPKLTKANESPCNRDNGGCEHFCLEKRLDDGKLGHSCACNVTWEIMPDNKSCHRVEEFLLFKSRKDVIGGYSFKNAQDTVIYPIYNNSTAVLNDIDYDYREGLIFYSAWLFEHSKIVGKICSRAIYFSQKEYCFENSSTVHIAYDWKFKNVYYLWGSEIYVTSREEKRGSRVIYTEPSNNTILEDVVVNPIEKRLYFVKHEGDSNCSAIVKVKNDGSEPVELIRRNYEEFLIERLAMDFPKKRIYWLERHGFEDFSIGSMNFDGSKKRTFPIALAKFTCYTPTTFTVHDQHIFLSCEHIFSDGDFSGVLRIDKSTGEDIEIFTNDVTPKVLTFSLAAQPL